MYNIPPIELGFLTIYIYILISRKKEGWEVAFQIFKAKQV